MGVDGLSEGAFRISTTITHSACAGGQDSGKQPPAPPVFHFEGAQKVYRCDTDDVLTIWHQGMAGNNHQEVSGAVVTPALAAELQRYTMIRTKGRANKKVWVIKYDNRAVKSVIREDKVVQAIECCDCNGAPVVRDSAAWLDQDSRICMSNV
jgi:hypothetical protein